MLAGLFTGARYGELVRVRVRHFDLIHGTLFIQFGKGKGGPVERNVTLDQEAIDWFSKLTSGREPDSFMFLRSEVQRLNTDEDGKRSWVAVNNTPWDSYDQVHAMEKAVKKAGIHPVTFHELRHTYASNLLNNGINLSYIAAQLGHKDLRMVTRHYGHIAEDAKIKAIRGVPRQNLT